MMAEFLFRKLRARGRATVMLRTQIGRRLPAPRGSVNHAASLISGREMMKRLLMSTGAVVAAAFCSGAAGAATMVTQNANAVQLANAIAGSGVTVTGASVAGSAAQFGTFTSAAAAPGIGFASGVVLSTGTATDLPGVNAEENLTTEFGGTGDARIDAIASAPGESEDVAALNFDFTLAQTSTLFFEFVFGSDEYLEFVNQGFNDAFGFFLDDGPNLAVLPGAVPISIDSINATTNAAQYRDNPTAAPAFDVRLDGLTTAIVISVANVAAGAHRFSFVIGDVGDQRFDSAIFIRGASFGDGTPPPPGEVPIPGAIPLLLTGLAGLGLAGRRKKA